MYSKDGPKSLAPKINEKIDVCMDVIRSAPITNQQKIILTQICVIPKANYAPLCEQTLNEEVSEKEYLQIDIKFAKFFDEILKLNLSQIELMNFLTNARIDGGCELMLPGAYY